MRWWYVRQGGQIRWGLGVPRRLWWVLILWVQCGQLGKGSGRSRATQVSPGMRQSPAWLGPPPAPAQVGAFLTYTQAALGDQRPLCNRDEGGSWG